VAGISREVFTQSEVASLNAYQEAGYCHPFTCPNSHYVASGELFMEQVCLQATPEGWICWWPRCDYKQDWAHAFMKDWSWLEARNSGTEKLQNKS
jgi:hypothetical protein